MCCCSGEEADNGADRRTAVQRTVVQAPKGLRLAGANRKSDKGRRLQEEDCVEAGQSLLLLSL